MTSEVLCSHTKNMNLVLHTQGLVIQPSDKYIYNTILQFARNFWPAIKPFLTVLYYLESTTLKQS